METAMNYLPNIHKKIDKRLEKCKSAVKDQPKILAPALRSI